VPAREKVPFAFDRRMRCWQKRSSCELCGHGLKTGFSGIALPFGQRWYDVDGYGM
jgi:hypothetical protein